nr:iron-containing alcohol dehydrogenase [Bacteroidales bacterium]
QFSRIPAIHFGNGTLGRLPEIIGSFGRHVLIVTGKSSFTSSPAAGALFNSLDGLGISYDVYRIMNEPSPADVDDAVKLYNTRGPDVVAGIGGGSAIDGGKAISAMLGSEVPVKEYLEGVGTRSHPGHKIPYIAVPTTSGTGSEATKNAVLSEVGEKGFKRSLRHDNFVPDIAVVDPLLTIGCPPEITAASGLDCFTQLLESYLSVKASEYTDALALAGLKAVRDSLPGAYADGKDTGARSGMSFAALTSGICLANAGLGVVHGFASSIGAVCEVPHGLICGTLMAVSNEVIVRKLRNNPGHEVFLRKYSLLGELFANAEGRSDDYRIDAFIDYLHTLTGELRLPGLKAAGLDEQYIESICRETDSKNNPVPMHGDELEEILTKRYF